MIMQCIFAFCAIISFSVINEAPKKCLFINGVLGMAGWAVYLYIDRISTMLTATFVSGLVLAVASHILARILKTPVTTMLIPAILTIVPGAGMYQTVSVRHGWCIIKSRIYDRCSWSDCYCNLSC